MSIRNSDVAVIGAGILGLAHAYAAARAGKSVVVFDRSPRARGASVRNFGMIWPIGQPHGRMHQMALRSRTIWQELLDAARLPYKPEGSFHVVYHADEAAVVQEFVEHAPSLGYDCAWMTRDAVLARTEALQPQGLLGALWSPTELTVDPRQIIATLPDFLAERYSVRFEWSTVVHSIALPVVEAGNKQWHAEQVVICSGEDFETLYPEEYAASGLTRCKLQMLRTVAQPSGWNLGPSLASGLTLRHYASFEVCSTLPAFRKRVAQEMPAYDRWGIHALVSQTVDGALTLGDSHEYGLAVDIFNKDEIDRLILDYTYGFLRAPNLEIAERWYGVYAKHPDKPLVRMTPADGVCIAASPGGSGMTLSFGMAEETMNQMGITNRMNANA